MHPRRHCFVTHHGAALLSCVAVLVGCEARELPSRSPEFKADVEPVLQERCTSCHGGDDPEGGYSTETYLDAIGCTQDGDVATLADEDGGVAPLLAALEREDHEGLLSSAERSVLSTWVDDGARSLPETIHPVGWLDPRSESWHGAVLRQEGFARMLDHSLPDACGRCHAGAPSTAAKLTEPAERAPACTSCHGEPKGVLACGTCHGDGARRAEPPRDPCAFPGGPKGGAHAAHLGASKLRVGKLGCDSCHPGVDEGDPISGDHANGSVDVVLDPELAGKDARYDASAGTCTVTCHSREGARAEPSWLADDELGCGDCHGAPPADHYVGKCSSCHPGANDDGTALGDATLHMNGRVDLGRDGSGRCGGCHGQGDDPWPSQGAHPAHRAPAISAAIACDSCHLVPKEVLAPGHLDREPGADVTFSGLATARGAEPTFDADDASCAGVACHGAGLASARGVAPKWIAADSGAALCGSCHSVPPPAPHTGDPGCAATLCHGGEISSWPQGPRISPAGKSRHVDGDIDVGAP